MTHIYISKRNALFILFTASVLTVYGQIRITDVDPATNAVTLHNYGGTTVDVSTYYFCNFPAYSQIGGMAVISGSITMNPAADLSVTSTVNFDPSDAEFGLYINNLFGSSSSMLDYMQWGSAGHQRESVAMSAGVWTAGTFIDVPPPFEYTGNGTQTGVTFWQTALGLEDFANADLFEFIRNPVEDQLEFQLSPSILEAEVRIQDLNGKTLLLKGLNSSSLVSLNVSTLSDGLYFLRLSTAEGSFVKRFIKQ